MSSPAPRYIDETVPVSDHGNSAAVHCGTSVAAKSTPCRHLMLQDHNQHFNRKGFLMLCPRKVQVCSMCCMTHDELVILSEFSHMPCTIILRVCSGHGCEFSPQAIHDSLESLNFIVSEVSFKKGQGTENGLLRAGKIYLSKKLDMDACWT